QVLELDVLERDFHRLEAGVDLPGDDAFVRHLREVAVHGRLAVEFYRDVLADALDGVVVEVLFLEDLLDQLWRGLFHHAAEVLAVEAAPENLADVALRAFPGQVLPLPDLAADLDAAVADAVLQAHLKPL